MDGDIYAQLCYLPKYFLLDLWDFLSEIYIGMNLTFMFIFHVELMFKLNLLWLKLWTWIKVPVKTLKNRSFFFINFNINRQKIGERKHMWSFELTKARIIDLGQKKLYSGISHDLQGPAWDKRMRNMTWFSILQQILLYLARYFFFLPSVTKRKLLILIESKSSNKITRNLSSNKINETDYLIT